MQPDTMSASESMKPQSSKSSMMSKIILGVLVLALLGVGFWGFQTNSKLTATNEKLVVAQSDLATLQGKYDSLTKDNAQLTSDLAQTKADLEKAQTELAKAQADLTKSQGEVKAMQAKISAASNKADILYAYSTVKTANDILTVDAMIKATNDADLIAQWATFVTTPTTENGSNFLLYMMMAIQNDLK